MVPHPKEDFLSLLTFSGMESTKYFSSKSHLSRWNMRTHMGIGSNSHFENDNPVHSWIKTWEFRQVKLRNSLKAKHNKLTEL
jgi:hypothetical protein